MGMLPAHPISMIIKSDLSLHAYDDMVCACFDDEPHLRGHESILEHLTEDQFHLVVLLDDPLKNETDIKSLGFVKIYTKDSTVAYRKTLPHCCFDDSKDHARKVIESYPFLDENNSYFFTVYNSMSAAHLKRAWAEAVKRYGGYDIEVSTTFSGPLYGVGIIYMKTNLQPESVAALMTNTVGFEIGFHDSQIMTVTFRNEAQYKRFKLIYGNILNLLYISLSSLVK